jgi:hypothetical protein
MPSTRATGRSLRPEPMHIGTPTLAAAAYVVPFIVFLAIYVPAAGHGFISDDFNWILHNRIRSLADIWRIALSDNVFYRPAVAFSFAANELTFGQEPRGYGVTNVALAALCGAAVYVLCRTLSIPRGAAAFGAALWLLNLHGINMGILWISGRTALIATAAAAACAAALLRGRYALATAMLIVAVLSREDAALLPVVTAIWAYVLSRHGVIAPIRIGRWVLISVVVLGGYFAVRSTTEAMTPATAPAHYRFTTSAQVVIRNLAEYSDRTMTVAVGVLVLLAIVLRPGLHVLDASSRAIVLCGLVWLGMFLAPALGLPVRSSLYACLPSAGACVAASAVAARWWSRALPARRQYALVGAVLLPLFMWPIHHARTKRWVGIAEFSAQALSELGTDTRNLPEDSKILIVDTRSARANMASAFSTLLREAFLLTSGRYMTFYVEPPIPNADGMSGGAAGCGGCEDLRLTVRDGRLQRDSIRNP